MENVWIKRMVKAFWNLEKVKQEAGTLGIFTDERELLECPSCGLPKDVTEEGGSLRGWEMITKRETKAMVPSCETSAREINAVRPMRVVPESHCGCVWDNRTAYAQFTGAGSY